MRKSLALRDRAARAKWTQLGQMLIRPMSALGQKQTSAILFDHLIGAGKY